MKSLSIVTTIIFLILAFSSKTGDCTIAGKPRLISNFLPEVKVKPKFSLHFFEQQVIVESNGNQNAVSRVGAIGVAQFMPRTWRYLKNIELLPDHFDINNAEHQRTAQKLYMNHLEYLWRPRENSVELAIASYNAGIGRVGNLLAVHGDKWRDHLPSETKQYLVKLNVNKSNSILDEKNYD